VGVGATLVVAAICARMLERENERVRSLG
jgi:undecaprenyl-diphosphatase